MVSVIGGGPGVMVNLEVGWRGGGRHGAVGDGTDGMGRYGTVGDVNGTPWDALPWWEWTRRLWFRCILQGASGRVLSEAVSACRCPSFPMGGCCIKW
jgi:hypothetical protein